MSNNANIYCAVKKDSGLSECLERYNKASGSRAEIRIDLSNGKHIKDSIKSCMRERKKLIF